MDVISGHYHGGRPKRDLVTGSRECFKIFKQQNPTIKITYKDYNLIIRTINQEYSNYVVSTGELIILPRNLGTLGITKVATIRYKNGIAGPVNWKATDKANKELPDGEKKIVIYHLNYHTDGFICNWRWFKGDIKAKILWKFHPSKKNQSLLTEIIRNKPDVYQFYKIIPKY